MAEFFLDWIAGVGGWLIPAALSVLAAAWMVQDSDARGLTLPVWRAAVLLLLAALVGIGLISAGVFDPKPMGEFVTGLQVESLSVEAGGSRLHWLDRPLPAARLHLPQP